MSYKKTTSVFLLLILIFTMVYFFSINSMDAGMAVETIGPDYFPNLLSVLLVILCIISFFQTLKKPDKKINLPNFKYILLTIGITILFLLAWYYLEYFYVFAFSFVTSLFILYKVERTIKSILICAAGGIIFTVLIYFVFGQVMGVRF